MDSCSAAPKLDFSMYSTYVVNSDNQNGQTKLERVITLPTKAALKLSDKGTPARVDEHLKGHSATIQNLVYVDQLTWHKHEFLPHPHK